MKTDKMKALWLLLLPVLFLHPLQALSGDAGVTDKMLSAYSDMQYNRVRELAGKDATSPEVRLVVALSKVFDRRSQDLDAGMPELKKLYEDKSLCLDMRLEAGLSYARAAQTLRLRNGVYPPAKDIDSNAIYDSIIADAPSSAEACFAITYQVLERFSSSDEKVVADAFEKLESFIKAYKGSKQFLGPLHYLLADQYIIHGGRYDLAVKQLEMTRDLGIANPRNSEAVALRIARIYDINLNDKAMAELNYNRFLKEFPTSASVPVVKRYLLSLSAAKKESGNG